MDPVDEMDAADEADLSTLSIDFPTFTPSHLHTWPPASPETASLAVCPRGGILVWYIVALVFFEET